MDPTAQNAPAQPPVDTNTQQPVQQAQPVAQPVQPAIQQPSVQTPPVQAPVQQEEQQISAPVGGKEQEATVPLDVEPSQPEVAMPQEVIEAGVEKTPSQEPQLSEEHKQLGVEAVKEATPVPQNSTGAKLPDNYKAPRGFFALLHQHVKNAATWLYLLLFKAQQQMEKKEGEQKTQ